MKGAIIGAMLLSLVVVGVVIFIRDGATGDVSRIVPLHDSYSARVAKNGWIKGATDPKVTVIEYNDYQCINCAAFQPILTTALQQTSSYVQLIFRNYPLPQDNKAHLAAEGAEAAGRQGKFWEMHTILFSTQSEWIDKTEPEFTDFLTENAQSLGLNTVQYRTDLAATDAEINKDITSANTLGVRSVPALFINGTYIQKLPTTPAELIALLEAARDASSSTISPQ